MDELIGLFPTPCAIFTYKNDIKEETKFIENLQYEKNNSNIQLKTSDTFVLKRKELEKINNFIKDSLKEYAVRVLATDQSLYVTQSWCNKNSKGATHHRHAHPNSLVSGVFYFRIDDSAPILFHNKQNALVVEPIKHHEFNNEAYGLKMKNAELILFPSHLEHSVPENKSDMERISLSFNTFSDGVLGKEKNLTYLNVKEVAHV